MGRCPAPTCALGAPGALSFETDDPAAIAELFRDVQTLGVAVSSAEIERNRAQ